MTDFNARSFVSPLVFVLPLPRIDVPEFHLCKTPHKTKQRSIPFVLGFIFPVKKRLLLFHFAWLHFGALDFSFFFIIHFFRPGMNFTESAMAESQYALPVFCLDSPP